jgi:hypothetical protein
VGRPQVAGRPWEGGPTADIECISLGPASEPGG